MKQRFGNLLGIPHSSTRSHTERRRKLGLESLEGRRLLAADLMYHNQLIAADANRDFDVTPLDALVIINALNRGGPRELGLSEGEPSSEQAKLMKVDVNGDNYLSPLDVLLVVNHLRAEGEEDALLGFSYQISDLSGNPLSPNSIVVGQDFRVNVLIDDLRAAADAIGVFTGTIDLGVTNLDLVEFQRSTTAAYRVGLGPLFGDTLPPTGGEGGGIQITTVGGVATAADSEFFELGSLRFEFDTNGAVTAGNVAVNLTGTTASTVVNAMVAAINGSSLGTVATNNGLGVVGLPDSLQQTFVAPAAVGQNSPSLSWSDVEQDYFNDISLTYNDFLDLEGPTDPTLFFFANFTALETGTVTFNPNYAESGENALFGSEDKLPNSLVMLGSAFSVTIIADPTAPVAVNDTLSSPEDANLTFVAATLLANDTVTSPRTLSLVSVNTIPGVTRGTVNGLTYTPEANFFGQDRVTYTIQDSTGLRSTATVTLNITSVNDAPLARPDSFTVVEDSVDELLAGLLNNDDKGPANESADVLRISAVGTPNNGGSVRIAPNQQGLLYTPAEGFVGTETFTYTISDQGNLTSTATVTVEVEPLILPRARRDEVTFNEDSTTNSINVLLNDRVNVGEQAVLLSVTQPANGTVTIDTNGTADDQTDDRILYTPNANFYGTDTFTYVMNDTLDPQGENSVGTVTVTVTDINDPVILANDTASATEDTTATFTAASLLANDSPGAGEAGRQTLTITNVAAVAGGGNVVLNGTNIVYTPAANFNGTFRFTYTATDNGSPASSATATVTVTVAAVNDNPVAAADTASTNEDTALTISASTLLANDSAGPSDESSQTLSITGVSSTSTSGGVVALAGTTITYTPAANFNGTDTFTYTLSDGAGGTATGTVTVNVLSLNDAPIVRTDTVVAYKDFPATILVSTLLANDSPGPANESTQGMSVISVATTANTNGTVVLNSDGTITYTPAAGYTGPASFTYTVRDTGASGNGNVNTATGTVNVTVQEFVPSTVGGTVWVDETQDGVINAAERRLGGVKVTLSGTSLGEVISPITLLTLADGSYQFDTLAPGQYTVSFAMPTFMLDNVNMADSYTINIVEPGGVSDIDNNFAVIGLSSSYARTIDQLASRYYMLDQSLIYNGAYFALNASGEMMWGANLDGYAGTAFSEAALDGNDLLLTVVDSAHTVRTARLARGEYLSTRDTAGNTLIRVLGGSSHFSNWQTVNLAAPPVVSSASRYLDSVDAIFDQEDW